MTDQDNRPQGPETRPGETSERLAGLLAPDEYVEQAYFYRVLSERLPQNVPIQELLMHVKEELLSTTNLPMAIDFFLAEVRHTGTIGTAMARLPHYFTSFQTFVVQSAEDERGRFDMRVAIEILRKEADMRRGKPSRPASFLYQFEVLSRNRLEYDRGLNSIAKDPIYDEPWREWINTVRRQLGLVDFAEMVYVRSLLFDRRVGRKEDDKPALFGEKEGRIAMANRRKDPLFLFAAFQRQLNYPTVPRLKRIDENINIVPQLKKRIERLETRLKFLEEEQRKGAVDLSKFYNHPSVEPPPTP
ncbi:MAG: hypothetical protein VB878_07260 [Pirellulaceae bacterium]